MIFLVVLAVFVMGTFYLHSFFPVLVMEVLSRLKKRIEEGGFLSGFQASPNARGDLHIYHFLFTDDTILFCDASKEQDNNKTTQKDYTGIKLLTHLATSHCPQRSDDFIPTKQSTLSILESNSKCSNYASQATNANKITIPPPILA